MKLGMYMGRTTKLPGSGILNFGHCAARERWCLSSMKLVEIVIPGRRKREWAQTAETLSSLANPVIGTLIVDGWAVTFGTARRGLGGDAARPGPSSLYQM